MNIAKKAAAFVLIAAFAANPLMADSDYGLVVKATNKLIDRVQMLSAEMTALSRENEALKERLAASEKSQAELMSALEAYKAKAAASPIDTQFKERLSTLEADVAGLTVQVSGIDQRMAAERMQRKPAGGAESTAKLKEQEARLKAYLDGGSAPDVKPMPSTEVK